MILHHLHKHNYLGGTGFMASMLWSVTAWIEVSQDSDGHLQRDLSKSRLHGEYKNTPTSIHKHRYENKVLYNNYSVGRKKKKKNPGHIKGKTQLTAARVSCFTVLNARY